MRAHLLTLVLAVAVAQLQAQPHYLALGAPNRAERSQTIHRMQAGGLFVGGMAGDSAMVQRIDRNGNVLWMRAFKPSTTWPCVVMHLNSTPDGHLIGAGNAVNTGNQTIREGFHFKMDTLGNLLWARRWNDTRQVYSRRIVPLSSSTYLLFADMYHVPGSPTWADPFTAHIDAGTGDMTWHSDLYDLYAPVPYIDDITGTAELDGSHYATGRIYTNGSPASTCRVNLSRFDSLGNHQWTNYLFYANTDDRRMYGSDIIAHDDSLTIAFFGNLTGSSANYTVGVARVDTAGNVAWARSYDLTTNDSEYASSIVPTANGYLVSGYGSGNGPRDLFLLEVSRDGTLLWSRSYGTAGQDEGLWLQYATNLALDGTEIVLTGRRLWGGNEDELLIRTDLTGAIPCFTTGNAPFITSVLPNIAIPTTWAAYPVNLALSPSAAGAASSILDPCVSLPVDLGPDTASCDSLLLDAGNPGATFLWSDGSTGQTLLADTGMYWVQVTLDCCTRTDTIHISGGDPPVADFTWVQDPPGSTDVVLTNTSVNDDWNLWIFGSTTGTGDPTTFSFQEYGHYMVGLVVGNDCGTDTLWQQVDVFPATGMAAGAGVEHLTCMALDGGLLVVLPDQGTWALELIDARGAVVRTMTATGATAFLPGPGLAPGMYALRCRNGQRLAMGRTFIPR